MSSSKRDQLRLQLVNLNSQMYAIQKDWQARMATETMELERQRQAVATELRHREELIGMGWLVSVKRSWWRDSDHFLPLAMYETEEAARAACPESDSYDTFTVTHVPRDCTLTENNQHRTPPSP